MNLLTSMPPTYQQVVLGKINQRKLIKGKENKLKTIKYEKGKVMKH